MTAAPPLDVGAVFVAAVRGRQQARRIVALRADVIVYCKGGDRNYRCRRASFRRWIRRAAASPYQPDPEDKTCLSS